MRMWPYLGAIILSTSPFNFFLMCKPEPIIPGPQIDSVFQFSYTIKPASLDHPRHLADDLQTPKPGNQNEFKKRFVYDFHIIDKEKEAKHKRYLFKVTLIHINTRIMS